MVERQQTVLRHAPGIPVAISQSLDDFLTPAATTGTLTSNFKLLTVGVGALAQSNQTFAEGVLSAAADAGCTQAEYIEAVLTAALNRGIAILNIAFDLLDSVHFCESEWSHVPSELPELLQMRNFLVAQNPLATDTVDLLLARSPKLLRSYFVLRSSALTDGNLPRYCKELLLVVLNAAQRFDDGVRVHLKAARSHGATSDQAMEAGQIAIILGGIPAWQCFSRIALACEPGA